MSDIALCRGGPVSVRCRGMRQGDGVETVLGGNARLVGALKWRWLGWWRFWPAEGLTELIFRKWHDLEAVAKYVVFELTCFDGVKGCADWHAYLL